MIERRLPRWSELRPLIRTRPLELDATKRRLARAHTIADLRAIAKRRTPKGPFDYTDGAAEDEITLRRSRSLYRRLQFNPAILRDVSKVDTSTSILGRESAYPFAFAPTGFTRMMQHEGEPSVVRAAERVGIPYALSTLGTSTIEEVAAAGPGADKWFQLYVWNDRAPGKELIERALAAGYTTLVLTVDVPVAGDRHRDVRNGLTIPPSLTVKTLLDMSLHPAWWFNVLTTKPLTFASMSTFDGTVAELINSMFDPTVTFSDLEWMREIWPGSLVIKGVQSVEDAKRVVDLGADGIVISNHGGRQLDRAPIPLELLPPVVEAVGDKTEVMIDTGVLTGADIVAGIALGASAVLVGRAYLYGLMAGGERGVQRAAEILGSEIKRTMQLLGVSKVSELEPSHVTFPSVTF
ncbi:alpha-hydroxy acid oxidase [Tenggerimyces flavus]|uniref:Alpha-hydroxy acid oxidase n=1 Tax=Tenggerimyces flavus TaxID=1708749 RepID=A0ABV7YCZ7_9ACTN|nr:alpha-hydroxy acid oxidase [Tenggerimyces flavus]MBM7787015.1 L-lactate dehydrogenase (cytochrome) [Tenggerimyces flavus]